MSDEQLSKTILNRINTVMSFQENMFGKRIRWFFSFGTLLEYIADRTFTLNFDIDIGVFYGECDAEKMTKGFEGFGYEVKSVLLHDVDRKPLNIQFRPTGEVIAGSPHIDVYFWIKSKNKYYHTYDINREGKKIPKRYVFKGIQAEWIEPDKRDVEHYRKSGIETSQVLDERGIWHYDIFGDHNEYTFAVPFKYGTLLDEWYPGWRFRQHYKGQSKSQWIRDVKSCGEL